MAAIRASIGTTTKMATRVFSPRPIGSGSQVGKRSCRAAPVAVTWRRSLCQRSWSWRSVPLPVLAGICWLGAPHAPGQGLVQNTLT